jgi:hypothetical protein
MREIKEGDSELTVGAVVNVSTLEAVENETECFSDRGRSLRDESDAG